VLRAAARPHPRAARRREWPATAQGLAFGLALVDLPALRASARALRARGLASAGASVADIMQALGAGWRFGMLPAAMNDLAAAVLGFRVSVSGWWARRTGQRPASRR
jgi:hypothetical protein